MTSDSDAANDGDGRDADPSDPGDWVTGGALATGRTILSMRDFTRG